MAKDTKKWVVTASGDLDDVKRKLTQAGFNVDQVLREIGIITGSASAEVAKRARSISGVTDVSPDSPVDIGPPDAPTTW